MAANGKFDALALAIASGQTIKAAAAAGCSQRNAYRHSATEKFRARVCEIRSAITTESVGVLTSGATMAANTLIELLGEVQRRRQYSVNYGDGSKSEQQPCSAHARTL